MRRAVEHGVAGRLGGWTCCPPEIAEVMSGCRPVVRLAKPRRATSTRTSRSRRTGVRRFGQGPGHVATAARSPSSTFLVAWATSTPSALAWPSTPAAGADRVCIQPLPAGEFQLRAAAQARLGSPRYNSRTRPRRRAGEQAVDAGEADPPTTMGGEEPPSAAGSVFLEGWAALCPALEAEFPVLQLGQGIGVHPTTSASGRDRPSRGGLRSARRRLCIDGQPRCVHVDRGGRPCCRHGRRRRQQAHRDCLSQRWGPVSCWLEDVPRTRGQNQPGVLGPFDTASHVAHRPQLTCAHRSEAPLLPGQAGCRAGIAALTAPR